VSSDLLAELQGSKLMVVYKRALTLEIDEAAVETAMNHAEDPKASLIALIVKHEAAASKMDEGLGSLGREELERLRARDLLARAQEVGLGDEALDAMDAEDPKAALIGLLLPAPGRQ
jgi:hypothetical protein